MTETQAKRLGVASSTQLSPHLEKCCLIVSANESYAHAAADLAMLTGINVSKSAQQRLVHRVSFEAVRVATPVEELSADGGKVRLRTPAGKPCEWRDYKAIALHKLGMAATFQDNACLSDWVNRQPRSERLTCIGDGHDGIWNLVATIRAPRQEILDWYHLVENLHKVGGSLKRLKRLEAHLWRGDVAAALAAFGQWSHQRVTNFKAYLANHRHRIPNYSQLQAQGVSIGSGAIESAIKQIGRRVKISGAQWKRENVPQVLRHRTAYLNGLLSS